jgi:hypothetical protein
MAGPSSLRSCALLIPTDDPRFAGLTKSGYFSEDSSLVMIFRGLFCHSRRRNVTCLVMGNPAARKRRFIISLSMPVAEPTTPDPTYASPASSNSPCMVPSSPKVPCSTGKTTSSCNTSWGEIDSAERSKGTSEPPRPPPSAGIGGTITPCPLASSAAGAVCCGSPARSVPRSGYSPANRRSASPETTQRPCWVMPIGTTS